MKASSYMITPNTSLGDNNSQALCTTKERGPDRRSKRNRPMVTLETQESVGGVSKSGMSHGVPRTHKPPNLPIHKNGTEVFECFDERRGCGKAPIKEPELMDESSSQSKDGTCFIILFGPI